MTIQTLPTSELAAQNKLATCRFAIEPLCFADRQGHLSFDSQAHRLAGSAFRIDAQALYDYLYFHVVPSPRTVFEGVRRVPAAHQVTVDPQGAPFFTPNWKPRFASANSTAPLEDLKQEFRALLEAAVRRQLDGSKPACFLSGGTDSSTVAGMIKRVAGQVSSYSIGFEAEGYDEMAYARIAARHFGTDHHEYYVTPADLVRSIPLVAAHFDQPFGNSSAVPAFHCARMAQQDGVARILAGDGGDELFGGNTRYAKQRVFGVWDDTPAPLKAILTALLCNPLAQALPLVKKGASYIRQASVPMPDRMQTYNLLERLGVEDVLEPTFLAQVDRGAPMRQQREVWAQIEAEHLLDKQLAFDWRYTLAENDLPKVVGTAALAGLEVGFPLLDDALVDFSLRLPPHYKLRGLKLRWFFKEALRGFLPDEILAKKKHGFGLPFGPWAVKDAALNALATESLHALAGRGLVKQRFVSDLMKLHLPQHPGYYGEMVWILMMLEQWLRAHAPDWRVA